MNGRPSDSMLPFVENTLCCELKEKFTFAMPRVVPDQQATFENDELFRKLSRESEVREFSSPGILLVSLRDFLGILIMCDVLLVPDFKIISYMPNI